MGDHGAGQLSPDRRRLPVVRTPAGTYEITLDAESRQVLAELTSQLRDAILADRDDAAFRRLFPPAHATDQQAAAEYRELVGTDLEQSKLAALETVAKTADATELTAEDLDAWARALNDVRLWMGTLLDVSEDDDPDELDDPPHVLYQILTWLQDLIVTVLSGDSDVDDLDSLDRLDEDEEPDGSD